MASVSNKEVKVGDWVWFKADVEQCGKIVKIKGSMLILQVITMMKVLTETTSVEMLSQKYEQEIVG